MRLLSASPSASRTVGTTTSSIGQSSSLTICRMSTELLHVLPSEARDVRLGEVEELGHDSQHTGEVAGPGRTLPPFRRRPGHDADLGEGRIHHRLAGDEEGVHAALLR